MRKTLQTFKSALTSIYPDLEENEWQYLSENTNTVALPSKSILIEENIIQQHLFFMTSGLVRGFYVDDQGEEITIRFIHHAGWITHYSALISKRPSTYIFQTLEPSECLALPFIAVEEGYKKFKGLEKFGRLIAENVLQLQQKRIEQFQFLSAEERYLAFIEDYPELFHRVSISHLCTYLGIKRQSLTRIRKKLASRQL